MRSTQSWLVSRSRYCSTGLPMPKMRTKMDGRCNASTVKGMAAARLIM